MLIIVKNVKLLRENVVQIYCIYITYMLQIYSIGKHLENLPYVPRKKEMEYEITTFIKLYKESY